MALRMLTCVFQRSVSPSKFESQATGSPTKLSVPSRKLRNQPANRAHDIEFAAAISTSLIDQVRNLQALLAEREEFWSNVAEAAIQESQNLKQPDYPQGHTHEELLASEAIRCLHDHSIIVKSPVVRPLPRSI